MPTATPSPHRFLAPNHPSGQKPKPKLPSKLHHGVSAPSPSLHPSTPGGAVQSTATNRVPPARRFVLAPAQSQAPNTYNARREFSTPRPRPTISLQRVESIDDCPQSSPSSSPLDQRHINGTRHPIEHTYVSDESAAEEDEDPDNEILLLLQNPNKRRRLSPQPPCSPSQTAQAVTSEPSIQTPIRQPPHTQSQQSRTPFAPSEPLIQTPAPAPPPSAPSHRFLLQTPAATANQSTTASISTTSRPHFLLPPPPVSPSKRPHAVAPLPETFSPSRKGTKFLSGGLASTLQAWVVETAQSGYQAQIRNTVQWGRSTEDGVRIRARLEGLRSERGSVSGDEGVECYAGGVVFAQASLKEGFVDGVGEGMSVNVLLAGQGSVSTQSTRPKLHIGDTVGVRAPTWEVDVAGERWVVGVDWVVL